MKFILKYLNTFETSANRQIICPQIIYEYNSNLAIVGNSNDYI